VKGLSKSVLLSLGLFLWAQPALAAGNAMNPRVRAHGGVVITEGPSGIGITGGMESRLSRLLYVDLGGMVNPVDLREQDDLENSEASQPFLVRHYIYILPGLRVPHRQPVNFQWDLNFRAGPAALWTAYVGQTLNPEAPYDALEVDVSMLGGVDLGVMFGSVGLRLSGQVVVAKPFDPIRGSAILLSAPQAGIEGFYQF